MLMGRCNVGSMITSETSLFQKFGWDSWKDITFKDVPSLLQLLPQLSPEVAAKALDIVLSVPQLASEMKRYYSEMLDKAYAANNQSTSEVNSADRAIIDGLLKQLDRENLTVEENKEIREDLREFSSRMHSTNTENKSWFERTMDEVKKHDKWLLTAAGLVVGGFIGFLTGRSGNNKQ